MSATLLAQLAKRGIHLRRVGDQLGVTANPGILTPEASAFLKEHKDALLAALDSSTACRVVEPPPVAPQCPGLTTIETELRNAEEALDLSAIEAHPTATCPIHGCPTRRIMRQTSCPIYRCPACVPDAFRGRYSKGRAA